MVHVITHVKEDKCVKKISTVHRKETTWGPQRRPHYNIMMDL